MMWWRGEHGGKCAVQVPLGSDANTESLRGLGLSSLSVLWGA